MNSKTIQKYSKKTTSWLKKEAQKRINKFVRLRDSFPDHAPYQDRQFVCIACSKTKGTRQMQAGHFYPAGKYGALRFDLSNLNGECVYCNYYSGDHLVRYQDNLIEKWGYKEFERIKLIANHTKGKAVSDDRFLFIEIIEKYK